MHDGSATSSAAAPAPVQSVKASLGHRTEHGEWLHSGDAMRVVAGVAVVFQHVAQYGMRQYGRIPAFDWWTCTVVVTFTKFAVPVFVMLSGALLLGPRPHEPLPVFCRKRFNRVGIPLIFWSLFYLLFAAASVKFSAPPGKLLLSLLSGVPYYHMHFMFIIAGLYLVTPPLRLIVEHAAPRQRLLMVGAILLLAAGSEAAAQWLHSQPNAFSRFVPYIGYYLAGYELRRMRLSARGIGWATLLLLVGATITATGSAMLFDLRGQEAGRYFLLYFSPGVMLMSLCTFLILATVFDHGGIRAAAFRSFAGRVSPAVLGVYLIHPAFLTTLLYLHVPFFRPNAVIGILRISLAALAASYVATVIAARVPYLRRVVG
jgi:surface polysaccharide O-acyltransferase-like enzyme